MTKDGKAYLTRMGTIRSFDDTISRGTVAIGGMLYEFHSGAYSADKVRELREGELVEVVFSTTSGSILFVRQIP